MAKFSDRQIRDLILERKPLKEGWLKRIQPKNVRSGKEGSVDIEGDFGSRFKLIIKQSKFSKRDFCLTLGVYPLNSKTLFRLLRYDGNGHVHSNKRFDGDLVDLIEYNFHIHRATERYQEAGLDEEYYAEPTDRYTSLNEALDCIIEDCNLVVPDGETGSLFGRIYESWP